MNVEICELKEAPKGVINYSDLMNSITHVEGTVKPFIEKVIASKKHYDNMDNFSVLYLSSALSLKSGLLYVNDFFGVERSRSDYNERLLMGVKTYVSYLKVKQANNCRKDIIGLYNAVKNLRKQLTVENVFNALRNNDEFLIYSDYYKLQITKEKKHSVVEIDGHKIDFAK